MVVIDFAVASMSCATSKGVASSPKISSNQVLPVLDLCSYYLWRDGLPDTKRERRERGRWCENDWVKPRFDPLALTERLLGCE